MNEILERIINIQNNLYCMCGLQMENFCAEKESKEYYAHTFSLGGKHLRFRIAKKTPTKTGQFVTMWKRMPKGVIGPFDQSDLLDIFIIYVLDGNKVGHFVFPKSALVENDIVSTHDEGGKRAMRIYAPWDEAHNIQSKRTQAWQGKYFVDVTPGSPVNIEKIKALYGKFE